MWGNSFWLPPLSHGVLPASAPDLGHRVAPLGRALCAVEGSRALGTSQAWCQMIKARHSRIHSVWFHLYKILEIAQLSYSGRKQI